MDNNINIKNYFINELAKRQRYITSNISYHNALDRY